MSARRVLALVRHDGRLSLRNGEQLLLLIGLPVLILVFFDAIDVLPLDAEVDDPIDFLAPGVLALAVLSAAFANLAIATGFERDYGALKRLRTTPLRRRELVAAKVVLVAALEAGQLVLLVAVGLALGWSPTWSSALVVPLAVGLATVAFVGLALLLAGSLPSLVVLAAANALYVVLLLVSGLVIPLAELPSALADVVRLLPSTALGEILQGLLRDDVDVPGRAWLVLSAWAVVLPPLAAWRWTWEPSLRR